MFVSGSSVRSTWLRHNLENFQKRLSALDAKVESEGIILTDEQVIALEKKKQDGEACGEIEAHYPGYLGSQDTFYVGNLKGVGDISANFCRYLQQGGVCRALHDENTDYFS